MSETNQTPDPITIAKRFRGFLPVVIDVETGGFNANTDALLELAAITIDIDNSQQLVLDQSFHYHIEPFAGANIEEASLAITGIKIDHPFRFAVSEKEALSDFFKHIRKALKTSKCQRAVLVGHNPVFDLGFLKAAIARNNIKQVPFHSFTTFDTATLSALAYGQTVLAKAVKCAGLAFDAEQAHSAIYDTERTAQLFCRIMNQWPNVIANKKSNGNKS